VFRAVRAVEPESGVRLLTDFLVAVAVPGTAATTRSTEESHWQVRRGGPGKLAPLRGLMVLGLGDPEPCSPTSLDATRVNVSVVAAVRACSKGPGSAGFCAQAVLWSWLCVVGGGGRGGGYLRRAVHAARDAHPPGRRTRLLATVSHSRSLSTDASSGAGRGRRTCGEGTGNRIPCCSGRSVPLCESRAALG
jgi:hypothetical protein